MVAIRYLKDTGDDGEERGRSRRETLEEGMEEEEEGRGTEEEEEEE